MIVRSIVIAAIAGVSAIMAPSLMPSLTRHSEPAQPRQTIATDTAKAEPASYGHSGRTEIPVGQNGHFYARVIINGRPLDGLIDTGASAVAINETTARRVGIAGSDIDYKYTVGTANGQARAASVMLKEVQIGNVRVRDVEAMVLEDKALSGMLVGMSFMKKLQSYAVKDGVLQLVQ
jgi:aspartyl protease family protein